MHKIEAIVEFLKGNCQPHLAERIVPGLEFQVKSVKSDKIEKGKTPAGYSWKVYVAPDGTRYKDLRIPWKAGTDPSYEDSEMSWELGPELTDGIGVSGWDWQERVSRFFIYDFDSVSGHKANALTPDQMQEMEDAVSSIPWVQIQKSKSGKGRHLFVFLETPEPCANHTEHAAMSRAILGRMSALCGKDLHGEIDCYGYLGWVWHRDTKSDGFDLVKAAVQSLDKVPADWRRHIDVVGRKSKKRRTTMKDPSGDVDKEIERQQHVPLDEEHQRLLGWFAMQGSEVDWTWDPELWFLQCHTYDLAQAHKDLELQGIFYTIASGENRPDVNCFAAPMVGGGWQIRRFGKGAGEHDYWTIDSSGWTRCEYNVVCPMKLATALHNGSLAPSGQYEFSTLAEALDAMDELGFGIDRKLMDPYLARKAKLEETKTSLVLRVDRAPEDVKPKGWTEERFWWCLVVEREKPVVKAEAPDDRVRCLVDHGAFANFAAWTPTGGWVTMPDKQAERVLTKLMGPDAGAAMNEAVSNPWTLVNVPFGDEYPGGRKWNRDGARFAMEPKAGPHPTWDTALSQLGAGLDEEIPKNPWCKKNGIKTGADYITMWLACVFQEPTIRLPYLFFFSAQQKTGKSTVHEVLYHAFKDGKGCVRSKDALKSTEGFNGGLSGAILCIVEEEAINRSAKNRMKDWVMGETIEIRAMRQDSRTEVNYTHWWQCANDPDALPIEPGDTRVTMVEVPELQKIRNRDEMKAAMLEELPAFLWTLTHLEIPEAEDRTGVPVIDTGIKRTQLEANKTPLQRFMEDEMIACPGAVVKWADFWPRFMEKLTQSRDRVEWDQNKVRSALPAKKHPRGKYGKRGDIHIGNVRWPEDDQVPSEPWVLKDGRLVR